MSRKFIVQKLKIASILLVILLMGTGLIGDKTKIKYHTQQIIELADSDLGLIKEYPAYKVPDLSSLSPGINKDWIRQLWSNFFNPKSVWTIWEDIYRHGTRVMGFSHEQMTGIGEALGFLKESNPDDDPIYLIGNSWRKVLWMAIGVLPWENNAEPYIHNFCEYEDRVIQSGQNYVRHDVIPDIDFLLAHCNKMQQHGITVELTFCEEQGKVENWRDVINAVGLMPNVIIECMNEFGDDWDAIHKAREIMDYALEQGCEVSGGAYGNSTYGEAIAKEFLKYHKGKYWTMHRPYPPLSVLQSYIRDRVKDGYTVLWNEILPYGHPAYIEPEEIEAYIRGAKDAGAVGFNIYKDDFALAGRLYRELNQ